MSCLRSFTKTIFRHLLAMWLKISTAALTFCERIFTLKEPSDILLCELSFVPRAAGRAWIQMVISFNEGAYKRWRSYRKNSTAAMGEVLWTPSF